MVEVRLLLRLPATRPSYVVGPGLVRFIYRAVDLLAANSRRNTLPVAGEFNQAHVRLKGMRAITKRIRTWSIFIIPPAYLIPMTKKRRSGRQGYCRTFNQ